MPLLCITAWLELFILRLSFASTGRLAVQGKRSTLGWALIPNRWMVRIDFLNSSLAVNSLNTIEVEYMIAILKKIVSSPRRMFSVTLLIPSRDILCSSTSRYAAELTYYLHLREHGVAVTHPRTML